MDIIGLVLLLTCIVAAPALSFVLLWLLMETQWDAPGTHRSGPQFWPAVGIGLTVAAIVGLLVVALLIPLDPLALMGAAIAFLVAAALCGDQFLSFGP